jgi:ABC-type glycerol-3-phosphate transport system permease component
MAGAVMLTAPMLVVFVALQRHFHRRDIGGAVK